MSIIVNNKEWFFCVRDRNPRKCFSEAIINNLLIQHQNIKELFEEDIKGAVFSKYSSPKIRIEVDNKFSEMMYHHSCSHNYWRQFENRIAIVNLCYSRVYAGNPDAVSRTFGRFHVRPECRNLKEYLKNKIVDKYLIDDVRDLIILYT